MSSLGDVLDLVQAIDAARCAKETNPSKRVGNFLYSDSASVSGKVYPSPIIGRDREGDVDLVFENEYVAVYVGNMISAVNSNFLNYAGIAAVVNMAAGEKKSSLKREWRDAELEDDVQTYLKDSGRFYGSLLSVSIDYLEIWARDEPTYDIAADWRIVSKFADTAMTAERERVDTCSAAPLYHLPPDAPKDFPPTTRTAKNEQRFGILINCVMGLNRSATTAVSVLLHLQCTKKQLTLVEVLGHVASSRRGRTFTNHGFLRALRLIHPSVACKDDAKENSLTVERSDEDSVVEG
eukprot:TRINITY_DN28775_c0_g1_i1.p1 TRINITY_DN28775_c0_g1~~TRINITY_DN28775_c0_g1_i1.p1  ORF type:complete len:294 (-),score=24.21 TRINITY_DN28775_c0_g1_i1:391-1272(-)